MHLPLAIPLLVVSLLHAQQDPTQQPQVQPTPIFPIPVTTGPLVPTMPTTVPSPMPVTYESRIPTATIPDAPVRGGQQFSLLQDVTSIHGGLPHYVVGIGIVTGLAGTGSSEKGTRQAILNFARDHGLNITISDVTAGNTALVSLTAEVPPFSRQGTRIDVDCQVIGDATSLRGGTLLRSPLLGVDNLEHVVVQGKVLVSGFTAGGAAASVQKNLNTSGSIADKGLVIREVPSTYLSEAGSLQLRLDNPSIQNALAAVAAIKKTVADEKIQVFAEDGGLVSILLPADQRNEQTAMTIYDKIARIPVPMTSEAKVVVDQASGTVLAGEGVQISPCVVSVSDLTISVVDEQDVSQPVPFGSGDTVPVNRTRIQVETQSTDLKPLTGGATVSELLQNLRSLGLTPSQLVNVFKTLHGSGYLHAPLEIQ